MRYFYLRMNALGGGGRLACMSSSYQKRSLLFRSPPFPPSQKQVFFLLSFQSCQQKSRNFTRSKRNDCACKKICVLKYCTVKTFFDLVLEVSLFNWKLALKRLWCDFIVGDAGRRTASCTHAGRGPCTGAPVLLATAAKPSLPCIRNRKLFSFLVSPPPPRPGRISFSPLPRNYST